MRPLAPPASWPAAERARRPRAEAAVQDELAEVGVVGEEDAVGLARRVQHREVGGTGARLLDRGHGIVPAHSEESDEPLVEIFVEKEAHPYARAAPATVG